ncbi:hypothetical protein MSSD1_276 [Mycoplasmopsis synoviae]
MPSAETDSPFASLTVADAAALGEVCAVVGVAAWAG